MWFSPESPQPKQPCLALTMWARENPETHAFVQPAHRPTRQAPSPWLPYSLSSGTSVCQSWSLGLWSCPKPGKYSVGGQASPNQTPPSHAPCPSCQTGEWYTSPNPFLSSSLLSVSLSLSLSLCHRERFETERNSPRFAKLRNWHHGLSAQILNVKS